MVAALQAASLFGVLDMQDQMSGKLDAAQAKAESFGDRLTRIGGRLTSFGAQTGAAIAPIVAALAISVGAASSFDEAMTNTAAVMGKTRGETTAMSAEILALGANSRAGPQAVAEAFYDIVGGVADASSRMAILNSAIATSEAGNTELAGTTSALIAVMNGYAFTADKAGYASDTMTQIVGKGVGTMEQLAGALPDVTGLAASMGIEFDDLGAAMAWVTTKGNTFSAAGTQIKAMMTAVLNPNEKMKKGLKELGFESGNAAVESLGLVGAYQALMGTQTANSEGFAAMAGSVEALNGAIALTGPGAEEFLNDFTNGLEGATAAAQEIQNSSPAATFDFLNSRLSALSITVGNALLPVLTGIVDAVAPIIETVMQWVQANPELVAGIGLVVGVLAALSAGALGLGVILGGLGAIIALLTSPITLVIGAVAALAAAYATNFGGIRDFVDTQVRPRLEQFFNWLGGVWAVVEPALSSLYDWFVVTALPQIRDFVVNQILPRVQEFFNFLGGVWDLVSSPFNALVKWFTVDGLPAIRDFITNQVTPRVQEFITTLQNIWNSVSPGLNDLKTNFERIMAEVRRLIQPVLDAIGSIGKAVQDAIKWIQQLDNQPQIGINAVDPGTGVTNPATLFGTPGFASGGWTGNGSPTEPAGVVHGQEWVVPRQGALVMRDAGNSPDRGGMNFAAGAIVIHANSEGEGRAAARGFAAALEEKRRSRG